MKTTINGLVVEGTPEEILALTTLAKKNTPQEEEKEEPETTAETHRETPEPPGAPEKPIFRTQKSKEETEKQPEKQPKKTTIPYDPDYPDILAEIKKGNSLTQSMIKIKGSSGGMTNAKFRIWAESIGEGELIKSIKNQRSKTVKDLVSQQKRFVKHEKEYKQVLAEMKQGKNFTDAYTKIRGYQGGFQTKPFYEWTKTVGEYDFVLSRRHKPSVTPEELAEELAEEQSYTQNTDEDKHYMKRQAPDKQQLYEAQGGKTLDELHKATNGYLKKQSEKQKTSVRIVEDEDINMRTLEKEVMPLFIELCKDKIANKGKFNFLADGNALNITKGWDWRVFCEEFLAKKQLISEYFTVEDRWELNLLHGKYHEVKYG